MEKMKLTPRLQAIAAQVPAGAVLADVGTDHGKLPVWLLVHGRVPLAIGSDIAAGPLDHARTNAEDHQVEDRLLLRLAPGLEAVDATECDAVSIAGMGGKTIAEILQQADWTKNGEHLLLLQPMTDLAELRQWLWGNGYEIEAESVCTEGWRYYVILQARGCAKYRNVPLPECYCSEALLKAEQAPAYLRQLLRHEERLLDNMEQGSAQSSPFLTQQVEIVNHLRKIVEALHD